MKTKIGVTVLMACFVAVTQAAAQYCELERIHYNSWGDVVTAEFSSVDTSTCELGIETVVHVEGNYGFIDATDRCGRGRLHYRTDTTTPRNLVAVVVGVYDHCLDTRVLFVTGTGDAEDLHVSNNFKTGSLRASFNGLDEFNQPVPIHIDLVWAGVGPKERNVDHAHESEGILAFSFTSSGTIRAAVAAGSVTVGDVDVSPVPSTDGTIERESAHSLVAYR